MLAEGALSKRAGGRIDPLVGSDLFEEDDGRDVFDGLGCMDAWFVCGSCNCEGDDVAVWKGSQIESAGEGLCGEAKGDVHFILDKINCSF